MKKLPVILFAVLLALLNAVLLPFSASASGNPGRYISEIKIGYGSDSSTARGGLEGYTILTDSRGNCVDLNEKSAGGVGSKGSKYVYFGYKTTDNADEAITDIAVMNMQGSYMVKDYKGQMEEYEESEIIPLVDNLISSLCEYRENYGMESGLNKARADYVHDILNRLVDDDTGKAVGDLLLNETKYEMGDDAYNSLSDDDKKEHADIVTLFGQANGKASFIIEHFLTLASDTSDDMWLDRLSQTEYDDLVDNTGLPPSKAERELSKQYYDDSQIILDMWDAFTEDINSYDSAVEEVNGYDPSEYDEAAERFQSLDENTDSNEAQNVRDEYFDAYIKRCEVLHDIQIVNVCDMLKGYEYEDGTLLDFFSRAVSDIKDNTELLYPVVASLSDGQKAGLKYVSLLDLCSMALADESAYSGNSVAEISQASVYENMDRTIYQPGGVALTSDAYRENADPAAAADDGEHSSMTILMLAVTGEKLKVFLSGNLSDRINDQGKFDVNMVRGVIGAQKYIIVKDIKNYRKFFDEDFIKKNKVFKEYKDPVTSKLYTGYSVVAVVLAGFTTYCTWRDITGAYDVDFTPVPKYMVDVKDITAYDDNGNEVVVGSQNSCYKVVATNRNEGDAYYDIIGNASDCNGCAGKQWLAMYSSVNKSEKPILASSLTAVTDDMNIPAEFETGIHMFGTTASHNLNDPLYVFGEDPVPAFIYFQREDSSGTGSLFTGNHLALVAFLGFLIGGLLGVEFLLILKKWKIWRKSRSSDS